MDRRRTLSSLTLTLLAALSLACATAAPASGPPAASPSASPTGTATGSPTASPAADASPSALPSPAASLANGRVESATQAAALVLASEARFVGVGPRSSDMIGQSRWYDAAPAVDGFSVSVTLGSGDCQAGCIDQHTWHYSVGVDGTLELIGEEGPAVDTTGPPTTGEPAVVSVRVIAGPVCPVERNPPDPQCAPRPVGNSEIVLHDPSGAEVDRGTTDSAGMVAFQVPAGAYYAQPAADQGFIGSADGAALSVAAGQTMSVVILLDTGIR